jgi:hypothetical protein
MRFLLLFLPLEIYGDFIEGRMMRRNSFKTKLVGYSLNISCDFSREKIKEIDRNHELQWIRPGKINITYMYVKLSHQFEKVKLARFKMLILYFSQ